MLETTVEISATRRRQACKETKHARKHEGPLKNIVIGKEGEAIKQIEAQSGVRAQIVN